MGACARRALRSRPLREVNLNAGCPSIEAGGGAFGASLMRDATLTRTLLESLKLSAPDCAVSLKCRLGVIERWDESSVVPNNEERLYEELARFVHEVSRTGACEHVVVHARVAALSGLSPATNRAAPPLKPQLVRRLARDFPHLRVTLNGGLSMHEGAHQLTAGDDDELDGLMFGRSVLRRPHFKAGVGKTRALGPFFG